MAFLLIGMLVSAPGTFLAGWGYHLQPPFGTIAGHMGSFAVGMLATLQWARPLLQRMSGRLMLAWSAVLASVMLLGLGQAGGSNAEVYRNLYLCGLGLSCGGLMAATFQLLQPIYEQGPGATVNLAGGLMGLGCLCPALVGWFCYSVGEFELVFYVDAGMAAAMAWVFFASKARGEPTLPDLGFREVLREIWSPLHVLFAALLFFQTAAEFCVSQWTALHLTLRSGMSPGTALLYLAGYFFLLWVGRFAVQGLMTKWPHRRILLGSAGLAWFGLLVLSTAENAVGAAMGLGLTAMGYAAVYPLLVEKIGSRFAEYHASFFHGIFGLGMMGGFLAPALGGWMALEFGEVYAMRVPLLASFFVFLLLVLIWAEAKLSVRQAVRS